MEKKNLPLSPGKDRPLRVFFPGGKRESSPSYISWQSLMKGVRPETMRMLAT